MTLLAASPAVMKATARAFELRLKGASLFFIEVDASLVLYGDFLWFGV